MAVAGSQGTAAVTAAAAVSRRRRPPPPGAAVTSARRRETRPQHPQSLPAPIGKRSLRARAAPDGGDAWVKYPYDPAVPREMTDLLRDVGDGEPSLWATKPPWCQPWTIVLTGSIIVYAPVLVFHAQWLSALVAVPIAAWWYVFLVEVPKQFAEYVETARSYYPEDNRT